MLAIPDPCKLITAPCFSVLVRGYQWLAITKDFTPIGFQPGMYRQSHKERSFSRGTLCSLRPHSIFYLQDCRTLFCHCRYPQMRASDSSVNSPPFLSKKDPPIAQKGKKRASQFFTLHHPLNDWLSSPPTTHITTLWNGRQGLFKFFLAENLAKPCFKPTRCGYIDQAKLRM